MAAAYLPAPGTEYGPCEGQCKHTDCKSIRGDATAPCTICAKPIGYETGHFLTEHRLSSGRTHAHSRCVDAQQDATDKEVERQATSLPVFEGLMGQLDG